MNLTKMMQRHWCIEILIFSILLVLSLSACGESEEKTEKVIENKEEHQEKKDTNEEKKQINQKSVGETEAEGPWTILVYMCGTDLESYQGSATLDIEEMLKNKTGKDCRFVLQTGGCSEWQNELISPDKTERYLIEDSDIKLISSEKQQNMGDGDTLKKFVQWGVKKYGKGKLGLILWDHGGGSLSGVCVDELTGDVLSLKEIDQALSVTDRKFEFVGFDACLMSTVETAVMLSDHAHYMIASEETESGYGWDYRSITKAWNKKNDVETEQLGKAICDGFMKSCKKSGEEDQTTLAVTDLSKIAGVTEAFDKVAMQMSESLTDIKSLGAVSKSIMRAENYGGNTPAEGYTNMVDLGNMAEKISKSVDTKDLLHAIDEAVVYQVKGSERTHAHGLSIYYPLAFEDEDDIDRIEEVSISDNYLYFVYGVIYGSIYGSMDGYTDEVSLADAEVAEPANQLSGDEQVKIKLKKDLYLNDDGYYAFTIDPGSLDNVSMVNYNLYMDIDGSGTLLYLGCDDNVSFDSETGQVEDAFEGYWPCLNGECFLTMYVVEQTDEHTVFSAPIYLNGEETNLRFTYTLSDEKWSIQGVWDGLDENGQADREVKKLEPGDEICPNYIGIDAESDETVDVKGDPIIVTDNFKITEEQLPKGIYFYNFSIDDIFGSTEYLDLVCFKVDKKGNVNVVE